MSRANNETSFFKKLIDLHHVLGKEVTCDSMSKQLGGKDIVKIIERETNSTFKKDILLQRLAQYAYEGNIAKISSLLNIRPDLRRDVLFTLAGLAAQNEMQGILQEHPEDLLVSRELTDISGAYFPSITLFQHCLWTKDVRYMANMMLDCLPKTVEGEAIRLALVEQFKVHQRCGVTYILNRELYEGSRHFDLQSLIQELQNYVDGYDEWTINLIEKAWCTHVGMAQRLLPAHIRHHYCDSEDPFWANVNLAKPKLKRTLELYNWLTCCHVKWSPSLDGLGRDFGIYCGAILISGCARFSTRDWVRTNLDALMSLDKMRTSVDLPALQERLHTPIQLEDDLGLRSMEF